METDEAEIQKRIVAEVAKARQQQAIYDFGTSWFTEALAHTGELVQRGVFPRASHDCGVLFYQQFLANAGGVKPADAPAMRPAEPPGEKPEEEQGA